MRIDEFPTHTINGISYCRGHVLPFGASIIEGGINFSINSSDATDCTLVLFHSGEEKPFVEIPFPKNWRVGDNFAMIVFNLDIENIEYGFRFDGEYNPARGFHFDKRKILLDPYAYLISGNEIWGSPAYRNTDFPMRGKILQHDYDWEDDVILNYPMEELIIYELHVRGFTNHPSSKVKYPGTYSGLIEKIPYLKELGVNCVELLPIFEFDEKEYDYIADDERKHNFWGYSTVSFFAPKAGYAVGSKMGMAADELKNMIKHFHKNGIEVILDVVFNHTSEMVGEGNSVTHNYFGIDASTYYIMNTDGSFANYSGCGNTFNCNNPIVRNHILDCIRYWVADYHIDGFRFDEAPILSRDVDGNPMLKPPLLEALAMDPVLSKTKLIAEAWDASGLYQLGNFPAPERWAEWNGHFRDCVRYFLCGEGRAGMELLYRIQGSPDIYPNKTARSSINFITCHDGFTLNDLFSYNTKHNYANGEFNRDGVDNNISWNCGAEGETSDAAINFLRNRNIKNALLILLISRGVPMLYSGDEFRNSQNGNNNAYCQDNEISWLNWEQLEKHNDIFTFLKKLIELRKNHPIFRKYHFQDINNSKQFPEVSFHGTIPWNIDKHSPILAFGVLFIESRCAYDVTETSFIYVAINSYHEEKEFFLPEIPEEYTWRKYLYSADNSHTDNYKVQNSIVLMPRSSFIIIARQEG